MCSPLYLVLYAYTIYITYIVLYLCLVLSWGWCEYVIKSNYVNAGLFLKKMCSQTIYKLASINK